MTETISSLRSVATQLGMHLRRLVRSKHFILYLTVAYFLVLVPFVPRLASPENLGNVFSNFWPLFAVATGQTFVLLVAGIDLSQPSVMATTSVAGAAVMTGGVTVSAFEQSVLWGPVLGPDGGLLAGSIWAVPTALLVMAGIGVLIGVFNGSAVAHFRMPPFMVTLVGMIFFSALAVYLSRSENIANLPSTFVALGKGSLWGVPWPMIIGLVLGGGAYGALNYTIWGRWLFAVGRNRAAARVSGVPVKTVLISAYAFSGFCAAVGAVLYSARLEAGRPTLGDQVLLDIVGATVIGGNSLFGGRASVLWTAFGVLFFTVLANSLNLMNLSFYTVDIIKGAVIVGAAFLDVWRARLSA